MDAKLKLKGLLNEHQEATIELLWNKIYDMFRYLNDIADLSDDANILAYLRSANNEEPDYRQDISVNNKDIDPALRRYMLEAAMQCITVDFHIDPLENLSPESTLRVLKILADCFGKIFDYRGSSRAFLHIKTKNDCVHIQAKKVETLIFDEVLAI